MPRKLAKYAYHRVDANADTVIDYLEAHGASVARCGRPVDVIVGYRGLSVVAEIKTVKGKLEASQRDFLQTWRGAAAVLRGEEDAAELLKWMEVAANWLPTAHKNALAWMLAPHLTRRVS